VEFLRKVRFRTSRGLVVLHLDEAKEFQYRLSEAPGGRPLEHQIQQAIDKAAAVSVLAAWFDEVGEPSSEMGELLVMLREE
jgi:RNase H-fold protein (predicted Holliday junction resolvase)